MAHSQEHAERWLRLISQQSLPDGMAFSEHISAGRIQSLCSCGCHGFGFFIPEEVHLKPISNGAGLYCEIAFASNTGDEINILLFTDKRGYFAGADVTFGQDNAVPMHDDTQATSLIGIWPRSVAVEPNHRFNPDRLRRPA
jgi:hypothetical protein